ncbi:hypothetical protein BBP40_005821 [Aspergillus hancockii]|nr:hypothetical protein BBP40_005821 [Aspergillus hancockii]
MTIREYDQQRPAGFGDNNNYYPPQQQHRPDNLTPQPYLEYNSADSSGYNPYPRPGTNPPDAGYNQSPANYYPPPSDYNRSHSPYQPQPWVSPSPVPSNYSQQPGGPPYPNPPYPEQPQYSQYDYPQPNQTGPYPPQPRPPSSLQPQAGYGQHPPAPPPYSPQLTETANPETDEKDRGFLGAVAGGAAGAYGGHKVNHGFLGAVGGAITGHVAQDALKKHKEKKEEEEKRKQWEEEKRKQWVMAQQHAQQHAPPPPGPFVNQHSKPAAPPASQPARGNFSASSRDVRLEGNHDLVAHCRAISGEHERSSIPLNNVLSNNFGNFVWARGGNFGASARNIRLIEGGKVLEAELANGHGGWNRSWARLDERISNQNGSLVFLD